MGDVVLDCTINSVGQSDWFAQSIFVLAPVGEVQVGFLAEIRGILTIYRDVRRLWAAGYLE